MSLLGVAGAVTDKVVSVSVERTSVNKDLSRVFENYATGPHGLPAGSFKDSQWFSGHTPHPELYGLSW